MDTASALWAGLGLAPLPACLWWIRRLRQQIAHTAVQLDFLQHRDQLTGLPNLALARDRLARQTAPRRCGRKVAVVALDIDDFRTITHSFGCAAADALLRDVAQRLQQSVRISDTVSRRSGDEFLLLLGDLRDAQAAAAVMGKVSAALAAPFFCSGLDTAVAVSMGAALYPDDGTDFETLARKATTALGHAKRGGGNCARFFAEQMNGDGYRHFNTVNALRRAIDNREFVLHYQPQYDLHSGRLTGAEALIRWQHPHRGLVPPGEFIPAAEKSGLIVPIGEWALHEACRQAVTWSDAGEVAPTIAINISALQFRQGTLEQNILDAIAQSGIDPRRLELEITESALLQDSDDVMRTVDRLGAMGVTFSVDDFGTGYSSLSYLHRFAVHKLKIDQSFIRDLRNQPGSVAIVRAIIQMASGLGLETVAEGIEDEWSQDFLRAHQCDLAQGFLFSRPLPAERFAELLAATA